MRLGAKKNFRKKVKKSCWIKNDDYLCSRFQSYWSSLEKGERNKFIEILKKRTSQALETKISGEFY